MGWRNRSAERDMSEGMSRQSQLFANGWHRMKAVQLLWQAEEATDYFRGIFIPIYGVLTFVGGLLYTFVVAIKTVLNFA